MWRFHFASLKAYPKEACPHAQNKKAFLSSAVPCACQEGVVTFLIFIIITVDNYNYTCRHEQTIYKFFMISTVFILQLLYLGAIFKITKSCISR
jgi:hypothetical protein